MLSAVSKFFRMASDTLGRNKCSGWSGMFWLLVLICRQLLLAVVVGLSNNFLKQRGWYIRYTNFEKVIFFLNTPLYQNKYSLEGWTPVHNHLQDKWWRRSKLMQMPGLATPWTQHELTCITIYLARPCTGNNVYQRAYICTPEVMIMHQDLNF